MRLHREKFYQLRKDGLGKLSLETVLCSNRACRRKVTAESVRAVASACGSMCGCENASTCMSAAEGICAWSGSGYHWAFLLSACPCVLRCTCGFSVGVPVVSAYGFLCVRVGVLKGKPTSKQLFQTSIQGPRLKVKMSDDICYLLVSSQEAWKRQQMESAVHYVPLPFTLPSLQRVSSPSSPQPFSVQVNYFYFSLCRCVIQWNDCFCF